jgi:hypothetical protein
MFRTSHEYVNCTKADVVPAVLVEEQGGGRSVWRTPDGKVIYRSERMSEIDQQRWGCSSDDAEWRRFVVTWRVECTPAPLAGGLR